MQNRYLASKPRYEILDGLRGVAAVVILVYHLFEACGTVLGHAYLGVDFFFALSGFVIGYAYDDRWDRMSVGDFFKRRLVRLHPMLIMGTTIGFLLYYFGKCEAFPYIGTQPWWWVMVMYLYTCLMLPMAREWDLRGWDDTNSFNGSTWSLQWEYIANILYALVLRFLPKAALIVLTAVAAMGTIDITFNLDMLGLLEGRFGAPNTVNGGWNLSSQELYVGAVRLAYPFLMGLLLSRLKVAIKVRGAFALCSLLVAVMMLWPVMEGSVNGIYEAACILILIPAIVAIGAGSTVSGKPMTSLCKFLGEISYPLYITHLPLIYMQLAWMSNNPDATKGEAIVVAVAVAVLSIGLAYASLKLYDLPVREWLTEHWLKRKAKK
ncbi:MAG: acyltransferase [Alistipes sp.]|nr:acyltransferase [Alistipes sp.]